MAKQYRIVDVEISAYSDGLITPDEGADRLKLYEVQMLRWWGWRTVFTARQLSRAEDFVKQELPQEKRTVVREYNAPPMRGYRGPSPVTRPEQRGAQLTEGYRGPPIKPRPTELPEPPPRATE